MHIIYVLVVGLIVGALAKLIMPGKDPGGLLITMALGVAGAFLAGMAGFATAGRTPGIIASVIGAIVLLAIYRFATQRKAAT